MSTKSIITGSDVSLVIKDKDNVDVTYTPQTLTVTLTSAADRQEYNLVNGGVAYKTILRNYELAISGLADWGHTDSVCDALEQAFTDDPDTSLTFTMSLANDPNTVSVTGKVFPKVPVAGGTGAEVTQFDVTLLGDVNTALTYTSAPTPS
jgi:hypothetical protein